MSAEPLLHLDETEMGEQTAVDYDDAAAVKAAIADCIAAAQRALPPQTVYEIRGKTRPDDPILQDRAQLKRRSRDELAKDWGVAWYWNISLPQEPLFHHPVWNASVTPLGGCVLIARLRTD